MDDFRGELRELRDEDCGEPRAVGALVGDEAAGAGDPVEVRRQRVFRVRRNAGTGAEKKVTVGPVWARASTPRARRTSN